MTQLISIVTLTYRKFENIYNAIDSVLMQDYPNIEYIISDDGSPDFPKEELQTYVEKHKQENIRDFRIIIHEENQGTVKNLNDAYRCAKGDIIIPVSEDDSLLEANVVSRIVKVFDERNCDVLMVGRALYNTNGEFVRNIPGRKETAILNAIKDNRAQYQMFVTGRFFEAYSGCALSVKKEYIQSRNYFDEKYTLWEDGPFFAQYLWDHYLECEFDLIGIRYNEGGVSSGEKHPLLLKDDEIFRETDLVEHIEELSFCQKEMVKYRVMFANEFSGKNRIKAAFKHPVGFIGTKIYRLRVRLVRD